MYEATLDGTENTERDSLIEKHREGQKGASIFCSPVLFPPT